MYQWVNFALAEAPPHRPPLCLNMDETALIRHPTGLRGYVAKVSGPNCIAVDKSSLADRRCYMTYLACVADDPSVQPKLPQVILGNEHQLTLDTMRSIAGDLPPGILVWRQKTSWNSQATMRKWLTVLANALGDVVRDRYVILLVDVHLSHIDETILQHARRCGIRLVYIPAKMTAYLQPCDTHLFAKFKHAFRRLWRECRSLSPDGAISMRSWVQVVCSAIQRVLPQTHWREAFVSNGLLERQRGLSARLRMALGLDDAVDVPRGPPSAKQALCVFPKGMKLNVLSYVLWQPKYVWAKRAQESFAQPSGGGSHAVMPWGRRRLPPSFKEAANFRVPRTID